MRVFLVLLLLIAAAAAAGIYAARTEPTSSIIDTVLAPTNDVMAPAVALPDGADRYSAATLASLDLRTCFDETVAFPDGAERASLQRDVRTPPPNGAWRFPDLADYPGLVKLEQLKSELGTQREHCGAARISEHWFMTASHCILDASVMGAPVIDLVLITPDVDVNSDRVSPVPVTGALCHHDFGIDRLRFTNDIALLYVADTTPFEAVEIVKIERSEMSLRRGDLSELYIAGWGNNGNSRFLQGGPVAPERVGSSVLVTARIDGRGPDVGDSGSPLYTRIDGEPVVMGVLASVRSDRPVEQRSAIFVRVKSVRDWLQTAMALCEQDGAFVCGKEIATTQAPISAAEWI
ncbi:MAG: S1 family peptidase [Pseudomonadota bacterium]